LPLHVVASEYWHAEPRNPALHTQVPLDWATPWPLHVVASEYWHVAPAEPALQAQLPSAAEQVPALLQVCSVPDWHAPAWQVSVAVHALLSLQLDPLEREEQVPFDVPPAAMLHA
jgi:hypothetical protein